jgi:zinc/manganese transport system substrate-binding protein
MTALLTGHRIRVLLYNDQTVSPITERLRAAARSAGIPVVPVSETLPPHLTFQQWQLGQARALAAALGKK